jgi:hypothetical protein
LKLKSIFFGIAATMSLNVNATTIYTSTFTDNGNKVTEVRTFADSSIQTWEWLDLTVTNGISYNSLIADLADDDMLNNSSALNANAGALADVAGLSSDDQLGWQTQSDQDIVDLFNNFFGLILVDDANHFYNANVSVVEVFITLFGDTYHEGRYDSGLSVALNGDGRNSGFSHGSTNTTIISSGRNESALVVDGQYHYSTMDDVTDRIITIASATVDDPNYDMGTWLAREVVDVNEPSPIVMFALALMGIGVRRRLM